jgi:hypothetical protein
MNTRIRNPKPKRIRFELLIPYAKRLKKLAHDHGVSLGREVERLAYQSMALR